MLSPLSLSVFSFADTETSDNQQFYQQAVLRLRDFHKIQLQVISKA